MKGRKPNPYKPVRKIGYGGWRFATRSNNKQEKKMLNGLWHVVFQVPGNHGGGVVVINGDKALGGDAACTYIGTVTERGGEVSGELTIRYVNRAFPPLIPQVPNYTVAVKGRLEGQALKLVGTIAAVPGAPTISITGTKHIDL